MSKNFLISKCPHTKNYIFKFHGKNKMLLNIRRVSEEKSSGVWHSQDGLNLPVFLVYNKAGPLSTLSID